MRMTFDPKTAEFSDLGCQMSRSQYQSGMARSVQSGMARSVQSGMARSVMSGPGPSCQGQGQVRHVRARARA